MSNLNRVRGLFVMLAVAAQAQRGGAPLSSLRTAIVPQPTGLEQYVADPQALIVLGKAFFWDMQAGSDGRTACASCHFHAGADHRLQSQLANPHQVTGASPTVNQTLTMADFPFRKLEDPNNRTSTVLREMKQVFGSAGVFRIDFADILDGSAADAGVDVAVDPGVFEKDGIRVRQVTGRNTPSVIDSVFNVRNFWDGRASSVFTGATPFGDADTTALTAWLQHEDGTLHGSRIRMENASLASQAVGPVLNNVEMSYGGRTWPKLGRKLLSLRPLAGQTVDKEDSVLGPLAAEDGNGLAVANYIPLIQAAFQPRYWNAEARNEAGYSQMELNFSLFWGLAIQAYESTLVSGQSRFDEFMDGKTTALTAAERNGLLAFQTGGGECIECHMGPELSAASFTNVLRRSNNNNAKLPATQGFFRLGVSRISDDIGAAGLDDFGTPLFDSVDPALVQGVFKVPSLRNVELTGPYFHNGGQATLDQVVEFYGRQGDYPDDGNLDIEFTRIRLNVNQRSQLVALLKSMTDDRVKFERAPFDHPSICVPVGHEESSPGTLQPSAENPLLAADKWVLVPASGRNGNGVPLQTFEELLQGIGSDGSRAHHMTEPCPAR